MFVRWTALGCARSDFSALHETVGAVARVVKTRAARHRRWAFKLRRSRGADPSDSCDPINILVELEDLELNELTDRLWAAVVFTAYSFVEVRLVGACRALGDRTFSPRTSKLEEAAKCLEQLGYQVPVRTDHWRNLLDLRTVRNLIAHEDIGAYRDKVARWAETNLPKKPKMPASEMWHAYGLWITREIEDFFDALARTNGVHGAA
jgi:hypothetical protein